MTKKYLTEEMGEHEQWYAQASTIRDKNELAAFVERLMTEYSHDLDTVVHAMAAGSLACISLMNSYPEGDISTGQKHKLLGMIVRRFANMQGPIMILQWLGVLNHQNKNMFNAIPAPVWEQIRQNASALLEHDRKLREMDISQMSQQEKLTHQQGLLDDQQLHHLKSIQAGQVPWGLKLV